MKANLNRIEPSVLRSLNFNCRKEHSVRISKHGGHPSLSDSNGKKKKSMALVGLEVSHLMSHNLCNYSSDYGRHAELYVGVKG